MIDDKGFEYSDDLTILKSCPKTFRGDFVIPDSVTEIGWATFMDCSGLTSVTIPNSVTTIGDSAFLGCSGLTSVTIPDSVTTIGDSAFLGCSGLRSITIPNSITTIGNYAFSGCTGLTSVTIPNSVTTIGYYAFDGCIGLISVTIPNSVTTIRSFAFYNVNNIVYNGVVNSSPWGAKCVNGYVDGYLVFSDASKTTLCGCSTATTGEITVPNSVTTIGDDAFKDCKGLTSVNVPNSVTEIGSKAFSGCSELKKVHIYNIEAWCNISFRGNNPLEYAHHLFLNNQEIKELIIPNSVTTIREGVFKGCSGLTSVTIGNSVKTIGSSAFFGCSSLTSIIIPNSVTEIEERAFEGCSGLNSVTIGNSVTKIGKRAFFGCSSLTSIIIPDSVTEIGEGAFADCGSLTSINVDIGNTHYCSIDGVLFNYEKDILIRYPIGNTQTEYFIPNSVTTIEGNAFANCSGLTFVTIGNSVIEIGWAAFSGCSSLTSIIIGNSVTTIGDYAFDGCFGLTSITIPDSVKTIGKGAFSGCNGLTKTNYTGTIADWCKIIFALSNDDCYHNPIEYSHNFFINDVEVKDLIIPEGVESINSATFAGCRGLISVTIPNSVTKIGDYAFDGCFNLTSVTIGSSVVEIGWAAFGCCGLTKTNYTGTIAQWCQITFQDEESNPMFISHNFFINNIEVKDLIIPEGTDIIRNLAFVHCSSLTSIAIPNSVIKVGTATFRGCSGLTSIAIPNSVTKIGHDTFRECSGLREIIVPLGQKERFSKMDGLAGFGDKIIEQTAENDGRSQILLNLAKAYEMGVGVKQDEKQAYMFYKQAAEAGSQEAQQWIQNREELIKNQSTPYFLFFDTETTGVPANYKAPVTDTDNWPRLVQIGWILTNQNGDLINARDCIIRPQGFTIPIEASNVHHITTEKALRVGMDLESVLQEFYQDVANAAHIVGHNIDFDLHIVGAEFYRKNMNHSILMNKPCTCTMRSSVNFCAIPSSNGYSDYKWPKLQELYYKLFGHYFEDAHDAMADITATKECFFELKKRGII